MKPLLHRGYTTVVVNGELFAINRMHEPQSVNVISSCRKVEAVRYCATLSICRINTPFHLAVAFSDPCANDLPILANLLSRAATFWFRVPSGYLPVTSASPAGSPVSSVIA